MTREEVMDFSEAGLYYSFETDTGTWKGLLDSYKETAVVIVQQNGKKKMLQYVRIMELEEIDGFDTEEQANEAPVLHTPQKVEASVIAQGRLAPVQSMPVTASRVINNVYPYEQEIRASYRQIFPVNAAYTYDKDELKKKFRMAKEVQKLWVSVYTMFNDSLRNHVFKDKYSQIVAQTERLLIEFPNFDPLMEFLGHVHCEAKEYDKASKCFFMGKCYEYELFCYQQLNKKEKDTNALIASGNIILNAGTLKTDYWRNLFYYAGQAKKGRYALSILDKLWEQLDSESEQLVRYGLFYLIDCYNVASRINYGSNAENEVLRREFRIHVQMEILPEVKEVNVTPALSANVKVEKKQKVYTGQIIQYNSDQSYGFISTEGSEDIFFHLKQVEDYVLRRNIANDMAGGTYVTYTLAVHNGSIKERPVADHVKPLHPVSILDDLENQKKQQARLMSEQEEYKGYISSFEYHENYGTVTRNSDGKNFAFYTSSIKDPALKRAFAEVWSPVEMDISFTLKKLSGGNNVVSSLGLPGFNHPQTSVVPQTRSDIYIPGYQELPAWTGDLPQVKEDSVPSDTQVAVGTETVAVGNVYVQNKRLVNDTYQMIRNMFYDSNDENPFHQLKKITSNIEYFRIGCQLTTGYKTYDGSIRGVNLQEAEKNFIRAIQAGDSTESAISNLINIYTRLGGNMVQKGLMLLEEFGGYLAVDKSLNLHVQLIGKTDNFDANVAMLDYAIKQTANAHRQINYRVQMANAYYRNSKWDESIKCYEELLKYMDRNRLLFSDTKDKFNNFKLVSRRMICLTYIQKREFETAKKLAAEILKDYPSDIIAANVKKGDYEQYLLTAGTDDMLFSNEFEKESEKNNGLSDFAMFLLNQLDIGQMFTKFNKISPKIEDNHYTELTEEAKADITDVAERLKRNLALSDINRSDMLLGIARIAIDSRTNDAANDKKLALEMVRTYVGRSMYFRAQSVISSMGNIDTARFYWVEALKYLRSEDQANVTSSLNFLVASFFLGTHELETEIRKINSRKDLKDMNRYLVRDCLSVKDLLITIAQLKDKRNYISQIENSMYANVQQRNALVGFCKKVLGNDISAANEYDFKHICTQMEELYNSHMNSLKHIIESCSREWNMPDRLAQNEKKLRDCFSAKLLLNLDEEYLYDYIEIIRCFNSNREKVLIDEKEEGYNSMIQKVNYLIQRIDTTPTDFSYHVIRNSLEAYRFILEDCLNEMYEASKPEISEISLLSSSVFVKDDTVQLTICVTNSKFKQVADDVYIELIFDENLMELIDRPHSFSNIRSGERQECMVTFKLQPSIIREKQFDFDFVLRYKYHKSIDSYEEETKTEKMNVNLNSRESFVAIENMYTKISRSAGVRIPEMFKGRDQLINSICKSMDLGNGEMMKNNGVILWGQRRVGKNSVKDYLKEKISQTYPGAYLAIDLGSIGKCHTLKEILISMVNSIEDVLLNLEEDVDIYGYMEEAGIADYGAVLEASESYMSTFNRFMYKVTNLLRKHFEPETHIPLLYIDEFSYLYEWIQEGQLDGKVFMRFWKSFIQDYGICAIIIAQDNIPEWSKLYQNEFACMDFDNEITYLAEDGASELICDPCKLNGESRFSDDAVEYIYSLTKGSAYLIVILCEAIIEYLNQNYTEKVTKAVVQIVMEKDFIDKNAIFNGSDFEPQLQDVSQVGTLAAETTTANVQLLTEIACLSGKNNTVAIEKLTLLSGDNKAKYSKVFNRLKERKILESDDEYCWISMPLLKLYLLREKRLITPEHLKYI